MLWFIVKTVLVIDDDEILRSYFAAVLESLGMKVLLADDGDTAIEVMSAYPDVDLIVLDLHMKRMSGWQALPLLKRIKQDVKVLVPSAFVDENDEEKLKGMGVDKVLKKPFPLLSFRTTVIDLLGL